MNDHPLKGFWIVHTYFGDTPWQSIMDIPEVDAMRINSTLKYPKTCIDPKTGKEIYYSTRLEVEAWDRQQHIARNGEVGSFNPVYATLIQEQIPSQIGGVNSRICFPAEWIDPKYISITLGDSFPNFYHAHDASSPAGEMGKSYSADEFVHLLDDGQLPTTWPNPKHSHGSMFYIEARFYTRNLPSFEMASKLSVSQRPATAGPKHNAVKPADDVK